MAIKRIEILPSWLSVSLLPSLRWTTLLCSRKTALRGARLNAQLFALEITRASSRHNRMSTEPFTVHCNVLVRQLKQKGDENFLQHRFRRALQVKKKGVIWYGSLMASLSPKPLKGSTAPAAEMTASSRHHFFKHSTPQNSWLSTELKIFGCQEEMLAHHAPSSP